MLNIVDDQLGTVRVEAKYYEDFALADSNIII